jgi:DNA-binding beta-propeller fold protein YncE
MASTCTTLYALMSVSGGDQLLRFGATTPGTLSASTLITGVPSGVHLVSMSYRPSTGVLYAVGGDSQLYTIDTTAGAATSVGSPISPTLELTPSQYIAMAFVPGTDVIRIWNATGQNLRVGPTGGAATVDTRLPQGFGTGIAPRTIAFTTGTVTLYAMDALNDTLSTAIDATAGTIAQVGPLGINMEAAGLAILPGTTTAYAVTELDSTNRDLRLYSVSLSTGALTSVGPLAGPPGLIRAVVVGP